MIETYLLYLLRVENVYCCCYLRARPDTGLELRLTIHFNKRIPYQYFTLHSFILSATLSPRSPGPSGSPTLTRSGPEPFWLHQRPMRPVVPSEPPVYAARAGKPRPLDLLPELLTKISTINYLEMRESRFGAFGSS